MKNYIIKGIGGFYYVKTQTEILECKLAGILRKKHITPVAGDFVVPSLETGTWIINDILPRKNVFVRPRVANVDNFFIVVSTIEPVPSTLVIDKMSAIAVDKNATPYIIVTKTDIASSEKLVSQYKNSDIQVIIANTKSKEGLQDIRQLLCNKLSVFCGNSGVGKSTLISALLEDRELTTNSISKKLGRGKHTTREVELFELCDGLVADTPGFASLDMESAASLPKENLQMAFSDIARYFGQCKYTGCSHTKEKGCAVIAAFEEGNISASRYASYKTLYEQANEIKDWER
ncbi:MAG: ribosome small subunit-dependent GTPase A [Oscillospiraceae bacterium]